MKAESFAKDKKFFCDPAKLLPLSRFLPQPKRPAGKVAKSPGGLVNLAATNSNCFFSAEEVVEDEAVSEAVVADEVDSEVAVAADSVAVEADEADSEAAVAVDSVAVEADEAVVSAAEDEVAAAARAASSESSTEDRKEAKLVPPNCSAILLGQNNYDCSFLFLTLCSVPNANAF